MKKRFRSIFVADVSKRPRPLCAQSTSSPSGSFPNAVYLGNTDAPPEMDIVGVDPNEFMKKCLGPRG